MSTETRFRVAAPEVIHQEIDGEVVLIHLGRGTYHSLRGSGAFLFPHLERGASARDLEAALAARYDGDGSVFEREVARFLADLRSDELVHEAPPAGASGAPGPPLPGERRPVPEPLQPQALADGEARRPFEPPRIETFTDLQELILADPIHEVDAAGWPHMPPGGGAA